LKGICGLGACGWPRRLSIYVAILGSLYIAARRILRLGKGDAKVAGVVEEVTDPDVRAAVLTQEPPGPSHLFRADIAELVVVTLSRNRKNLVIEAWHPERGVTRYQR
jgi:hypothetical protein